MNIAGKPKGISRGVVALVILVIIILAVSAVYVETRPSASTTTSSTIATTSTESSSSSSTSKSTSSSTTSTAALPSGLVIDEASAPSSDDPGAVVDNNGIELAQNTVLPLIFFNYSDNSHYIHVLATGWNASADGLTYTFSLRKDAYFSNGNPFNAYVVWYNVYRDLLINQPVDFVMYQYFNTSGVTVDNVNALNNPQNTPDSNLLKVIQNPHNSVTVLGAYTVQFHLTYRFAAFLTTLPDSPWYFVDPYTVQQHGGVVANQPNSWMSVNGTSVGDGPYISLTYIPNQYSILIANPHYWAQSITNNLYIQPARIPKIVINYKTDELTRILDLTTGRSQASIISYNDVNSTLKQSTRIYLPNTGISGSVEVLFLNTERPPFDNLLLRRAIIAAINVTEIRDVAFNGFLTPVVGPLLKTFPGYNASIAPPQYNLSLAKKLLAQAGYPGGNGLPPITYAYVTSPYNLLIAQILVQQLNQIGVTVKPLGYNVATYVVIESQPGTNSTTPNMLALNGWTFNPDVTGYWVLVDDQQGVFHFLNNQTIHNAITLSNSELDPVKRAAMISQITEMVLQQAAVVWLGQDLDFYDTGATQGPTIWNRCVTGMWYNTAFNGVPFNSISYSCVPNT